MTITRREFTALTLLAAAGMTIAPAARRALGAQAGRAEVFHWTPVRHGVFVAMGQGGNAMLVTAGEEALLVDCKNAGFGAALRRECLARHNRLSHVLNTHHHADHSGGNDAFSEDTRLMAHANALPRIESQRDRYIDAIRAAMRTLDASDDPALRLVAREMGDQLARADELTAEAFTPGEALGDQTQLSLHRQRIELRHPGAGHTDNDVFVFAPGLNILHTGDLLFHRLHPFVDVPAGSNTRGWQRSLDAMIALCDRETIVVPGHGDITDVSALRRQRQYFDDVRDFVSEQIKREHSREDVVSMRIPGYEDYGFTQIQSRCLAAVYDELTRD